MVKCLSIMQNCTLTRIMSVLCAVCRAFEEGLRMIDIHSHVLPGIDDGSKNLEMSRKMLDTSATMGVTILAATPHFYADRMQIDTFLGNREAAYVAVVPYAQSKGIQMLKGAEVAFFRGIGRSEQITALQLEGTNLLLLEMPFRDWTKSDLKEVDQLIDRGITPILAHIERFYGFQRDKGIVDALMDRDVLVQINADPLTHWSTRGKLLKLIKKDRVHFLGSDCHNTTTRPQNLALGREVIRKKLGEETLRKLDETGNNMLAFSRR